MMEWSKTPEQLVNAKELKGWLLRSLEYAYALPSKGAKKGAPRAVKKSTASWPRAAK